MTANKVGIMVMRLLLALLFLSIIVNGKARANLSERPLLYPPQEFQAFDMPSDAGESIGLSWKSAPYEVQGVRYLVYMAEEKEGKYKKIGEIAANSHFKADYDGPWWAWKASKDYHFYTVAHEENLKIANGKAYYFKIMVTDGNQTIEGPVRSATPKGNLFNWAKLNNLALMLLFTFTVLISISYARRNPKLFLRRIAGLDAVEEAIGRATEMGRPILYLTGSDDMSSLSTLAATIILGEVAKRVASYETELKVPHRDPIVMAVCQEIVKEAYMQMGRPDAYKEDCNFFITTDQFAYTAAVDGIMLREKPAANFFMGFYYAESLLLAETGASAGAIQIAGTDSDHQLPFFITSCDYTLIGEELYAASAYLSREPVLLGTLRGQDIGKAFFLAVLVLGTILVTLGEIFGTHIFTPLLQIFKDFK